MGNGIDLRLPGFMNVAGLGTDFSSMAGLGGFGSTDFAGGLDLSILSRMLYQSPYSSYQSTAPAQVKPEERAEKVKELDKKIEEAKKEVLKEEEEQTKKTDEKKAIENKKYGFWDTVKSIGKGAAGIVTDMFTTKDEKGERHFSLGKTALTVGIAAAAIGLTILCPPLGTALMIGGAAMSGVQVVKGISDASNAKTYADKDAAVQEITEGGVGAILSVVGFKGSSALKASKAAKAAETFTGATSKLELAAEESRRTSHVLSIINDDAKLSENTRAVELIKDALKNGEPDRFPSLLIDANVENEKIMALTSALRRNHGPSSKDSRFIYAIEDQIDIIRNAGTKTKEKENAVKTLADLFKVTQKDGISAEVEATLARLQQESPELGKLLNADKTATATTRTVKNLAGREKQISDDLNIIRNQKAFAKPEDEALITEAIALLDQVKQGKINKTELNGMFERLLKSDSVDAVAKIRIASVQRAIATSVGESLSALPSKLYGGTKAVVTHPFTEPKDFGLKVLSADNFFAQYSNLTGEIVRQAQQAQTLKALDDAITAQKDKVTKVKNAHSEQLAELAEIYGVSVRDDKHELKTDAQLIKEINKAKDKEIADKKAKEAKAAEAAKATK